MSDNPLFAPLERFLLELQVDEAWAADLHREVGALLSSMRDSELKLNLDDEPVSFGSLLANLSVDAKRRTDS